MANRWSFFIILSVATLAAVLAWRFQPDTKNEILNMAVANTAQVNAPLNTNTVPANVNTAPPVMKPSVVAPIAEFKQRITKKFFGTFITPATSPVQPERFTGYHTGVDVEYTDTDGGVPVYAFADGTVVRAATVSGYGGVIVLQHTINDQKLLSLYGHLNVKSLTAVGTHVKAGDQIGVLGKGKTVETDFERTHLHFAIIKGTTVTYRGYATKKSDLSAWLDPLSFFP